MVRGSTYVSVTVEVIFQFVTSVHAGDSHVIVDASISSPLLDTVNARVLLNELVTLLAASTVRTCQYSVLPVGRSTSGAHDVCPPDCSATVPTAANGLKPPLSAT